MTAPEFDTARCRQDLIVQIHRSQQYGGVSWKARAQPRSWRRKASRRERAHSTPSNSKFPLKYKRNDPTKKFQAVQQIWYAPVIDHWVKRSFVSRSDGRVRERNTIELVEYGRR